MNGLNVPEYDLKGVTGKIFTRREVKIPPFMTNVVKGITNLMTHSKCMNVVVELVTDIQITLPQPDLVAY